MKVRPVALLFFSLSGLFALLLPARSTRGDTVEWSGLKWFIRNDTGGPGPNTFASKNVTVAADGSLHLQIRQKSSQNSSNGSSPWTCAELYTTNAMGYGTYEFEVESRVDQLDANVVFGMFGYPTAKVGPDGTNEMDIEYARWGNPAYPNGNYTVWPALLGNDNAFYTFEFNSPGSTTQRYMWSPGLVEFQTFLGFGTSRKNLIAAWSTPASYSPLVSNQAMPVHINLWLFAGQPPTDGKRVEIILKSFKFKKA